MEQWQLNKSRGISLIEVLIAVSIFSIVATASVGVFISSERLSTAASERHAAYQYAASGLEAVRSIKDEDFSLLEDGTHGLEISGDIWTLNGSSDEADGYTRVIEVTEIDDEVKEVLSRVTWDSRFGSREAQLVTQFTDWEKVISESASLSVDVSGIDGGGGGNKDIEDIFLTNLGGSPITLDTITISWTRSQNSVREILIDTMVVWSHNGPGSPTGGNLSSGTLIDIEDYVILPGSTIRVDRISFTGSVKGDTYDIIFGMSDGSTVEILGIDVN